MNKQEKRALIAGLVIVAFFIVARLAPTGNTGPPIGPESPTVEFPATTPTIVTVPNSVGQNAEKVSDDLERAAREAGYYSSVNVQSVYSNATESYDRLVVCGSNPAPGAPVNTSASIVLYGTPPGTLCPSVNYATLNYSNLPTLPDSDGDQEADYKDPYPHDPDRSTLFPNGKQENEDSGISEPGAGTGDSHHSHHKGHHSDHGGLCSKKWWC